MYRRFASVRYHLDNRHRLPERAELNELFESNACFLSFGVKKTYGIDARGVFVLDPGKMRKKAEFTVTYSNLTYRWWIASANEL